MKELNTDTYLCRCICQPPLGTILRRESQLQFPDGCSQLPKVRRENLSLFSYHRPNPWLTFTDICTCSTGRDSGLTGGVTENGVTESLTVLVQGGVFGDTATTKIFIMTPATLDLDLTAGVSSADQRASLTNGDFQPLFDGSTTIPQGVTLPDRLTPIKTQLGQLMPGVPISQFTYRRQTNDRFLSSDGYGKATVSVVPFPLHRVSKEPILQLHGSNKHIYHRSYTATIKRKTRIHSNQSALLSKLFGSAGCRAN